VALRGLKKEVVITLRVEGGVKVNEINALVTDVIAKDFQIVPKI